MRRDGGQFLTWNLEQGHVLARYYVGVDRWLKGGLESANMSHLPTFEVSSNKCLINHTTNTEGITVY